MLEDALGAGGAPPRGRDLARPAQRAQRARARRRADAASTSPPRRSAPRSRRSTSTSPSSSSPAPFSSGPTGRLRRRSSAGWGDGDRPRAPVPAAGGAHPAPARPRAHARGRAEGAARRPPPKRRGEEVPELVPLRRVRPRDVLTTAALVVAAYLLITKLAKIGFGTIAHELRKAEPGLGRRSALILAQLTFIGAGDRRARRGADAAPAAPVRRAAVGDQVHQPDRAELGGPHRDRTSASCSGMACRCRRGGRRGRGRRRVRTRSSRSCSSLIALPFVHSDVDTSS